MKIKSSGEYALSSFIFNHTKYNYVDMVCHMVYDLSCINVNIETLTYKNRFYL